MLPFQRNIDPESERIEVFLTPKQCNISQLINDRDLTVSECQVFSLEYSRARRVFSLLWILHQTNVNL